MFQKLTKRNNIIIFIITYLSGIAIYSLLITQNLVNTYDGILHHSFNKAGDWEVSCGRFVWPYLDIMRARMSQNPYMSLISLLLISVALILIDKLIDFKKWYFAVVFNLMFIANVVVCVFLSHRFMSPTFATSVLTAVFAIFSVISLKGWLGIIVSGISVMLTMGLYQANIGCACVVFLVWIVININNGVEFKEIGEKVLRVLIAFAIGAVLYIVLNKLHLKIYSLEMASYNGGNTYSIGNTIMKFSGSIGRTYSQFIEYFFEDKFLITVYQRYKIFVIIFCLISVLAIAVQIMYMKKNLVSGLVALILILLFPIAANAILIVATDSNTSIQMTAPTALVIPALFAIVINATEENNSLQSEKVKKIIRTVVIVVGCAFIYLEGLQVCIDQDEMREGTKSTTWMFNETIDDLKDNNLLNSEYEYCYIGKPIDNKLFGKSDLLKWSNSYSQVGNLQLDDHCAHQSWNGVKNNLGGVNIRITDDNGYERIMANQEVKDMPVFPEEGYIKKIDDIVVVKISDE